MDPNLITISSTFILDNPSGPIDNVQDTTNYVGIGINNSQVKGNVVGKYGATIFHGNPTSPNWTTPDINRATSNNVSFALPVDSLGKVINTAYVFLYIIQILQENLLGLTSDAAHGATAQTQIDVNVSAGNIATINAILVDPTKANVNIAFYASSTLEATSQLVSVTDLGGGRARLFFASCSIPSFGSINNIKILADGIYQKEFDYTFCNITPKAELSVQGDFLRSQLNVRDVTNYPANLTSSTRVLKINYPNYTNGTPTSAPVSTSQPTLTIGPNIYTGNYHTTLTTQILYTQTDSLIVQDTIIGFDDYPMNYNNTLCGLASCISSLRTQYRKAEFCGSANEGELFKQNFQVLLFVNDYSISVLCGNSAKAMEILQEISTYLRQNCGCNCGCEDDLTQQGEPRIIYAVIPS